MRSIVVANPTYQSRLLIAVFALSMLARSAHSFDLFGAAVCSLPDVNRDGCPDFAIGDPRGDLVPDAKRYVGTGRVWIVSGKDHKSLGQISGERVGDHFGITLCGLGDVDRDGIPDLAVGAAGDGSLGPDSAAVYIVSCKTLKIIAKRSLPEDCWKCGWESSGAGPCFARVPDMNKDGIDDLLVGSALDSAPGEYAGSVRLLSGRDLSVLQQWHGAAGDLYGFSVAGGADVDGDGVADLLVGAVPQRRPGYIALISGSSGKELRRIESPEKEAGFGFVVTFLDDLDGDGKPDILASAQSEDLARLWAFSGRDGRRIREWKRRGADTFGSTVFLVPDCDGDGKRDIVVTAPAFDTRKPCAWILSSHEDREIAAFSGFSAPDPHGVRNRVFSKEVFGPDTGGRYMLPPDDDHLGISGCFTTGGAERAGATLILGAANIRGNSGCTVWMFDLASFELVDALHRADRRLIAK